VARANGHCAPALQYTCVSSDLQTVHKQRGNDCILCLLCLCWSYFMLPASFSVQGRGPADVARANGYVATADWLEGIAVDAYGGEHPSKRVKG